MGATMTAEDAGTFTHYSATNAALAESACSDGTCEAYRDIFTFKRWQAQGSQVLKGEHGTRVTTWIPVRSKRGESGESKNVLGIEASDVTHRPKLRPRNVVLFCRHQVS